MADDTTHDAASAAQTTTPPRRWTGATILAIIVLVPVGILIFSNMSTETISWLGFEMTAPLWLILILTFFAGIVGGKVFGWAWRRVRRRRQRLKSELAVLRKHAADSNDD
jgi:uncharacterized integral membrane protein